MEQSGVIETDNKTVGKPISGELPGWLKWWKGQQIRILCLQCPRGYLPVRGRHVLAKLAALDFFFFSAVSSPRTGPELETHVARLAKRGEGGYTGYEEEYLILDQRSDNNFFGDFQEALKHINRAKNRYSNVLPLDRTRVVLSCTDEPGSDYINANFVDGVYEKQYIATQGPLKETSEDYWRMVWEQEVNVVVMLTKVTENSKIKCYKYWPGKTKGKTFGQFSVSLVSKEKEHGLVTRVVLLVRGGDAATAREVYHFQYK